MTVRRLPKANAKQEIVMKKIIKKSVYAPVPEI